MNFNNIATGAILIVDDTPINLKVLLTLLEACATSREKNPG